MVSNNNSGLRWVPQCFPHQIFWGCWFK